MRKVKEELDGSQPKTARLFSGSLASFVLNLGLALPHVRPSKVLLVCHLAVWRHVLQTVSGLQGSEQQDACTCLHPIHFQRVYEYFLAHGQCLALRPESYHYHSNVLAVPAMLAMLAMLLSLATGRRRCILGGIPAQHCLLQTAPAREGCPWMVRLDKRRQRENGSRPLPRRPGRPVKGKASKMVGFISHYKQGRCWTEYGVRNTDMSCLFLLPTPRSCDQVWKEKHE